MATKKWIGASGHISSFRIPLSQNPDIYREILSVMEPNGRPNYHSYLKVEAVNRFFRDSGEKMADFSI